MIAASSSRPPAPNPGHGSPVTSTIHGAGCDWAAVRPRMEGRLAFPERLLSEDEELIYDLRPHWLTLVVPVLITLVVVVAVGAAWVVMPAGALQQPARLAVGVLGVVVLLATVVGRVLRWSTTHFVLT